jgi:N-methylhydantoinase A
MLGRDELAGGLEINEDLARACLSALGEQLGLGIDTVAKGIVRIAVTHMAEAIRSVTVEQGYDPRSAALMAFGGAGPLFAAELARELRISTIVVPRLPGNFSAWGLLGQEITRSAARTFVHPLTDDALPHAAAVVAALFEEMSQRAPERTTEADNGSDYASMDLRYIGQEYTLTVPVAVANSHIGDNAATIRAAFSNAYLQSFGYALDDPVEIVTVRAGHRIPLGRRTETVQRAPAPTVGNDGMSREAYSFALDGWEPFRVVDRAGLHPGGSFRGPMIVREETSTTYVDADYLLEVDSSGALLLSPFDA